MPTYDFRHNDTGEEWEATMGYNDKKAYCEEHNCAHVILSSPKFVSGIKDVWSQTDEGFKERMKGIKNVGECK